MKHRGAISGRIGLDLMDGWIFGWGEVKSTLAYNANKTCLKVLLYIVNLTIGVMMRMRRMMFL